MRPSRRAPSPSAVPPRMSVPNPTPPPPPSYRCHFSSTRTTALLAVSHRSSGSASFRIDFACLGTGGCFSQKMLRVAVIIALPLQCYLVVPFLAFALLWWCLLSDSALVVLSSWCCVHGTASVSNIPRHFRAYAC